MRRFCSLAIAGALVMVLSGTAAAATPPSATYHGTWADSVICGVETHFSGIWNVNLKDDGTASISVRIFENDRMHAAWGGNTFHADWVQVPVADPDVVFKAQMINPFGQGIDLIFVLRTDGTLAYSLTNYCSVGVAAVLTGHLTD